MMHPKMKHIYVGVDTHKRTHTTVIINCFAEKLGEMRFENVLPSFQEFLTFVQSFVTKGVTPVFGLEDTGGVGRALTVFLLSKGKCVKKINSTMTSSERKKLTTFHKTDSFDAQCVAKVLLDGFTTLPNADPHDIYWTLRMLVRRRSAIVKASTALKNQIHAYIMHHYPSYKKFFHEFDCQTALAFWETYPSPSKLDGVDVEQLAVFLRKHSANFFSTKKATQILALVKHDGDTSTQYQDSRDFMVSICIREFKQNMAEASLIQDEIKNLMSRMEYKLETMIGLDTVSASAMIAEIGDINRFENADKLSRYAGIAPVTIASGDKDRQHKNRRGNRVLYQLFLVLAARNISQGRNKDKPVNPIMLDYYQKKISQGKTKHQATICVMRRLVNIVYGMLKNKTEYTHPKQPRVDNEN